MKMVRFVVLSVALLALSASGGTLLVPSQYATIQAAINASVNGDTVLIADGRYTGTGNKNLDFGGRLIVVMSENGPETCAIDCQTTGQGFYFHSGESTEAVVYGLAIKNGNTTYGGGVRINSASPTIERCIIWNNVGTYGGGIYINSGYPEIIHCSIVKNSATNGGAVYLTNSSPLIHNNVIADNAASG